VAVKPRAYIETTIISYLTAWPSSELVMAAHQQITKDWWESQSEAFFLFASELVVREAQAGDSSAAERRIEVIGSRATDHRRSDDPAG
jgi:hypothetical protein